MSGGGTYVSGGTCDIIGYITAPQALVDERGDQVVEAIAPADDSVYGLAASVYTDDLRNAIKVARAIRAGVVTVNCFGGRDKSQWAHDQYTEIKTIWIDTQ